MLGAGATFYLSSQYIDGAFLARQDRCRDLLKGILERHTFYALISTLKAASPALFFMYVRQTDTVQPSFFSFTDTPVSRA